MPGTRNSYKANFNMNRRFGIEIELVAPIRAHQLASKIIEAGVSCYSESYNHTTPSGYWKITTDASVNASSGQLRRNLSETMELVSPPLSGEEGFRQLKVICEVLKAVRADVNKTCGLHVHHDAIEFKTSSLRNLQGVFAARLYDAYAEYEGVIDHIVSASRRGNSNIFCRSHRGYESAFNAKATRVGYKGETKQAMTLEEAKYAYCAKDHYAGRDEVSRYAKVNLNALSRHGTIEFRQHNGTIDFEKIKNWVVFTQLFMLKAINTTLRNRKRARTMKEMIDWLRIDRDTPFHGHTDNVRDAHAKECADYLRNRFAHFAQLESWAVTTAF